MFTKCSPYFSFRAHSFLKIPILVKVEGLPLLYNKTQVARRALDRIGTVMHFDNDPTSEGFKDFIRAKVVIPINNPLVPGFYLSFQEGPREWVDFRYEVIFVFCNKCDRIGHRHSRCKLPIAVAQRHFEMVMEDIGQGIEGPIISQNFIPCSQINS